MWPVGQAVKTPPFHGGIGGSIPPPVTSNLQGFLLEAFFIFKKKKYIFLLLLELMLDKSGLSWYDNSRSRDVNYRSTFPGRLAQLGERLPYKQDVGGSIPSPPTIFLPKWPGSLVG